MCPVLRLFLTNGESNLQQHIPICKPFADHHQQVFVSMPNPSSYRITERVLSMIHGLCAVIKLFFWPMVELNLKQHMPTYKPFYKTSSASPFANAKPFFV
jgi:hypothetical protein